MIVNFMSFYYCLASLASLLPKSAQEVEHHLHKSRYCTLSLVRTYHADMRCHQLNLFVIG